METSEAYYSRTWEAASLAYEKRGFYKWCISQIPKGEYILEIGTGIGIVTLALMEAGVTVSSLEENILNFEKARHRLATSRFDVRFLNAIKEARQFFGENNLIKSNFITDWREVVNVIKYDTVICWFVGVHPMAHTNSELLKLGYTEKNFANYRDLIYNRIFQIISLRLEVGGVISLIERASPLTEEGIEHERKDFQDFYGLEKYGLMIENITQLAIGDITSLPGIEMVAVKDGATPIEDPIRNAVLLSYTIVKYKDVPKS
jgi:hypothetical protein